MRARVPSALFALLAVVALAGGCHPFAAAGEACTDAPCAAGLVCQEGVCKEPVPPPPDPEACEVDGDCVLNGSDDGRACVEGRCAWSLCGSDGDCGARVCDRGTCAERAPCGDDGDCGEGEVCEANACRSACRGDGECGGFSACDAGHCRQRCFFDLMCLGDICEDGLCREAECALDEDCEGDGYFFCDVGRCTSYLPCDDDADCFDPDYRCNELGRCEERPACRVDAECGADALCLGGRCRPTTACADDTACDTDEECVAGRCVEPPGCRQSADCPMGEVCVDGACSAPEAADVDAIVVGTPLGDCDAGGAGACTLVLFEGESLALSTAAFSEGGEPAFALLEAASTAPAAVSVVEEGLGRLHLEATQAGSAHFEITAPSGETHSALEVVVLPAVTAGLGVLVVDQATGAPVAGAAVVAGLQAATADGQGLALFPTFPVVPGDLLVTARADERGVALLGAPPSGALRFLLPSVAPTEPAVAAGFTARVLSSGDETGPVGLGLALPGLGSVEDASLAALLGPPFTGSVELPLLGALPVALPAAATLEASLPVLGAQVVRERAFSTTSGGRRGALAYEGRFPESTLFGLLGGAAATDLALNLAAEAEGMDALAVHAGALAALPLVVDGDTSDGFSDVDNDGDVDELVPDFASMPELEITPQRLPRERVGLVTGGLPAGARARAFVAAGLALPGYGFAPTGVGAISPPTEGLAPAQVKVVPPSSSALANAARAVVVEALFDDPSLSSRLFFRGAAFSSALDLGPLLQPPTGAFLIEGIPAPDERLLVLPQAPSATTYRVHLVADGVAWTVVAASAEGGRSVVLPASLGATVALTGLEVLRLEGGAPDVATAAPFVAGAGPSVLDRTARAIARAPAP